MEDVRTYNLLCRKVLSNFPCTSIRDFCMSLCPLLSQVATPDGNRPKTLLQQIPSHICCCHHHQSVSVERRGPLLHSQEKSLSHDIPERQERERDDIWPIRAHTDNKFLSGSDRNCCCPIDVVVVCPITLTADPLLSQIRTTSITPTKSCSLRHLQEPSLYVHFGLS